MNAIFYAYQCIKLGEWKSVVKTPERNWANHVEKASCPPNVVRPNYIVTNALKSIL